MSRRSRDDAPPTRPPTGRRRATRGASADGHHVPPRARRRSRGRRAALRRQRRRRTLLRTTLAALVIGAVAAGVVLAARTLVTRPAEGPPTPPGPDAGPPADRQLTMVLATVPEASAPAEAELVFVLAAGTDDGEATILMVPRDTVVDIPGHGTNPLRRATAFGGPGLLDATLENLLGVDLDHVAVISPAGWAALLSRIGGAEVEVPDRITVTGPDGVAEVRFLPGPQFLDGPRLAELMTVVADGESDLARLARAQRVLEALLEALADPTVADAVFGDGAPMLDTAAPPEVVRRLFGTLADAAEAGRLVIQTLPVTPLGEGDSYRPDRGRLDALVAERFAASVPSGEVPAVRDLQILNGNGRPGIGEEVARRLVPAGFRVVLTGNADRFDYAETRIVVYEDRPEVLAAAERIRELLGVGRVELSRTPQTVVDITIVVGRDFLEDR